MNLFWLCVIFLLFGGTQADDMTNSYCSTSAGVPGQCVPQSNCTGIPDRSQDSVCNSNAQTQNVCCPLNADGVAALTKHGCGTYTESHISNGQVAQLKTYRWMALLKYNDLRSPYKCGGSLINERYVLTAAHCIKQILQPTLVRLGEHTTTTDPDCNRKICAAPVQDIGIEEFIVHPDYTGSIHNDIALIRLNRTVQITRNGDIFPICLPTDQRMMAETHQNFIIAGWGNTETGRPSKKLKYIRVDSRDLNVCKQHYPHYNVNNNQICMGGDNTKKSSCKGDSGGPVTKWARQSNNLYKMVQYGVISNGMATCGEKDTPAMHTNVARYMVWITQNIGDSDIK